MFVHKPRHTASLLSVKEIYKKCVLHKVGKV